MREHLEEEEEKSQQQKKRKEEEEEEEEQVSREEKMMFSTVRAGWSAKFERENSIWQWDDGWYAVGRKMEFTNLKQMRETG